MRYDAVKFLESLFRPDSEPAPETADPDPQKLDPDRYEEWVERAGIMQFDGGLTRELAEALALREITSRKVNPSTRAGTARVDPPATDATTTELSSIRAITDGDLEPGRLSSGTDPEIDPTRPVEWMCSKDERTGLPSTGTVGPGHAVPGFADWWTQAGIGQWIRSPRST